MTWRPFVRLLEAAARSRFMAASLSGPELGQYLMQPTSTPICVRLVLDAVVPTQFNLVTPSQFG